ncbi:hypothetical protein PG994_000917 [Apiospora phragmitis]|uniref:Rhodopsin domain-containing protein n=1 Tax=Apiospora phragmitis TaxID=2905665 RepID=A0ABR1WR95_9PEZI
MAPSVEQSHVAFVTVVCTPIFTVLAIISVMLQAYAKVSGPYPVGLEDVLILTAFLLSLALVGQIMWAVFEENEGQHLQDVAISDIEVIAKSLLLGEILWSLVATLFRTATLIMIRRIFGVASFCRHLTLILLGLGAIHGVAAVLVTLLICQPIRANWDHSAGHCGKQTEAYVAFEVLGLILDLIPAVAPLYWVYRLMLPLRKRLYVSLILSVGFLVSIITGLRIYALDKVDSLDFTYNQAYLGLLSTLGALISVTLGCASSIAVLLNHCRSAGGKKEISKYSAQVFSRQKEPLPDGKERKIDIEEKEEEDNPQEETEEVDYTEEDKADI